MKNTKNIVFSTARQFNPGDEFILIGLINLLKKSGIKFNPIIYNRNPDIRQTFQFLNPLINYIDRTNKNIFVTFLSSFLRIGFTDNSWKYPKDGDVVDAVIFAGSPGWAGGVLMPLYKMTNKFDIPTYYIGIGIGSSEVIAKRGKILQPCMEKTWKKSKLITARDRTTYEFFKKIKKSETYLLPCPALFVSKTEKRVTKLEKIGIVFSTYKAPFGNNIKKRTYDRLVPVYKKLLSKYNCKIIAHYVDEVVEARRLFPEADIIYSYDAKEYPELYKEFDLIIGTRVHGSGLSSSLGIPSILVAHDYRSDAARGFMAKIVDSGTISIKNVEEEISKIKNNISSISLGLIKHKQETEEKYLEILKKHAKDIL